MTQIPPKMAVFINPENDPDGRLYAILNACYGFTKKIVMDKSKTDAFEIKPDMLTLPVRLPMLIQYLSRLTSQSQAHLILRNGLYDSENRIYYRQSVSHTLTDKEHVLFMFLYHHKNQYITRDSLLKQIWGHTHQLDTHTLETHIYRLRRKIEDDANMPLYLRTADFGYGYIEKQ